MCGLFSVSLSAAKGTLFSSALIPRSKLGSVISRGGLCAPENALRTIFCGASVGEWHDILRRECRRVARYRGVCAYSTLCIILLHRRVGREKRGEGRRRRGGLGSFECHPYRGAATSAACLFPSCFSPPPPPFLCQPFRPGQFPRGVCVRPGRGSRWQLGGERYFVYIYIFVVFTNFERRNRGFLENLESMRNLYTC